MKTLNLLQTEIAIKRTKDFFEEKLADVLALTRVSAPLFVPCDTGLNDTLSGQEKAIRFALKDGGEHCEIVHSLAKWKRLALKRYGFVYGQGLYTDMNAIRKDESLDELHSIYVDQWDWEKIILAEERTEPYLEHVVQNIYRVFLATEAYLHAVYPVLEPKLPRKITFIDSDALLQKYPTLSAKEREHAACREYGAVFLKRIGAKLSDGSVHDQRAADYDDWELNGDILFYYPLLDSAFEVSSMGIRVDNKTLLRQLKARHEMHKCHLMYHQAVLDETLPLTIGGGIGQSRMCMFFLNKEHIGEVQASYWPEAVHAQMAARGITLL